MPMKTVKNLQAANAAVVLIGAAAFASLSPSIASASVAFVYEADGVSVSETGISCRKTGRAVAEVGFGSPKGWKIGNYRGRLSITVGKNFRGRPALFIGGSTNKCDTAWNAKTPKFAVPEGIGTCRVEMKVYSDVTLSPSMQPLVDISLENWQNAVYWYDASGRTLKTGPLVYFATGESRVMDVVCELDVPPGAAYGALRLGFDTPNIGPGQKLVFTDIDISVPQKDRNYVREASFVSEMRKGGKISWKADVPDGTSVRFQWRGAEKAKDLLSADFRGPDGTAASFYSSPSFSAGMPYVQYKAFLVSDGASTPVLKSVTVADRTDSSWLHMIDDRPPEIWRAMKSPVPDGVVRLAFSFADDSFVDWESVKISVDGVDSTERFVRDGNVMREREARSVPYSEGLHKVEIQVADCRGNAVVSHKVFYVGEPPSGPRYTLREDGMTLIDGKPFFPIGVYGVRKREFNGFSFDKAFRDLKEGGFNFAHTYAGAYAKDFLEASLKHDFKLWVGCYKLNSSFMNKGRYTPNILAWYLGDDTSEHATAQQVRDLHDSVTAVDPTRITCQADGVRPFWQMTKYARFVTATDVYMPEIYPIRAQAGHPSDVTCVADVIFEMHRVKRDMAMFGNGKVRACWPILQWFKGWGNWHHFPSREQLFATSFASIVHGANGITWYTYGGLYDKKTGKSNEGITSSPERWRAICDLAGWLKELSPVLLSVPCEQPAGAEILEGPAKDAHGTTSVTALLKRHEGKAYLIAVNAAYAEVRARFRLSGVDPVAEVLRENRSVRCPHGVLEDDFAPFAVHVYCLKERK